MDTIEVDPNMRHMLNEIKEHHPTVDDGHIIRALLRERIKRLKECHTL